MGLQNSKIITVDDFGIDDEANRLIEQAIRAKVITHASVMVNMPGAKRALEKTKSYPRIQFGLHLDLSESNGWPKFLAGASFGLISDIESQARQQIEKLQKFVKPIPFINSHHNVHFWPPIFDVVARLAKKYQIPKIRYPVHLVGHGLKPVVISLIGRMSQIEDNNRLSQSWLDLDWYDSHSWQKILQKLPSDIEISCHPQSSLKWLIENR